MASQLPDAQRRPELAANPLRIAGRLRRSPYPRCISWCCSQSTAAIACATTCPNARPALSPSAPHTRQITSIAITPTPCRSPAPIPRRATCESPSPLRCGNRLWWPGRWPWAGKRGMPLAGCGGGRRVCWTVCTFKTYRWNINEKEKMAEQNRELRLSHRDITSVF